MAVSGNAARRLQQQASQANSMRSALSPFAQLAQQAARQAIQQPRIADLRSLAQEVARQAMSSSGSRPSQPVQPRSNRGSGRVLPQESFRLPQASPDPMAPFYGSPAIAPGYRDQPYTSPARRYSESEIMRALAGEFALAAQASRSAAQDQVFVEGSRARNLRALQADALATQRYLADVAAESQRRAIDAQMSAARNAQLNSWNAMQMQMPRSMMQMQGASLHPQIPPRIYQMQTTIRRPDFAPSSTAAGASGSQYNPLAFAREQLAAQAAARAAEIASRERMQGAEIASRERMQAASIQGQKDLQQQSRELEDELRRRAALRALQAFNQASPSGRQIFLKDQGRV